MMISFMFSRRLCAAAISDVFLPLAASYWRVSGPSPLPLLPFAYGMTEF